MAVLRNNKDSLMAVLEAFVYDPLLNWRLIETGSKNKKAKAANAVSGAAGMENVAASGGNFTIFFSAIYARVPLKNL